MSFLRLFSFDLVVVDKKKRESMNLLGKIANACNAQMQQAAMKDGDASQYRTPDRFLNSTETFNNPNVLTLEGEFVQLVTFLSKSKKLLKDDFELDRKEGESDAEYEVRYQVEFNRSLNLCVIKKLMSKINTKKKSLRLLKEMVGNITKEIEKKKRKNMKWLAGDRNPLEDKKKQRREFIRSIKGTKKFIASGTKTEMRFARFMNQQGNRGSHPAFVKSRLQGNMVGNKTHPFKLEKIKFKKSKGGRQPRITVGERARVYTILQRRWIRVKSLRAVPEAYWPRTWDFPYSIPKYAETSYTLREDQGELSVLRANYDRVTQRVISMDQSRAMWKEDTLKLYKKYGIEPPKKMEDTYQVSLAFSFNVDGTYPEKYRGLVMCLRMDMREHDFMDRRGINDVLLYTTASRLNPDRIQCALADNLFTLRDLFAHVEKCLDEFDANQGPGPSRTMDHISVFAMSYITNPVIVLWDDMIKYRKELKGKELDFFEEVFSCAKKRSFADVLNQAILNWKCYNYEVADSPEMLIDWYNRLMPRLERALENGLDITSDIPFPGFYVPDIYTMPTWVAPISIEEVSSDMVTFEFQNAAITRENRIEELVQRREKGIRYIQPDSSQFTSQAPKITNRFVILEDEEEEEEKKKKKEDTV